VFVRELVDPVEQFLWHRDARNRHTTRNATSS
jgi:hypothetical protein